MAVRFLNTNQKKAKWIAISLAVLIGAIVVYFPNYAKLRKLKNENRRIILESEKLKVEIADYQEKIEKLGKDPYLYEKIARDDLGIARENEIVIDIE